MPTRRTHKKPGAPTPERLLQAKLPADMVKALRIHALEQETTVKEVLTRLIGDYLTCRRSRAGQPRQRRDT